MFIYFPAIDSFLTCDEYPSFISSKIMTEHKEASDIGSLCSSKAVFTFQKGAQKESEPVARKGLKLLRVACAGQVLFFL